MFSWPSVSLCCSRNTQAGGMRDQHLVTLGIRLQFEIITQDVRDWACREQLHRADAELLRKPLVEERNLSHVYMPTSLSAVTDSIPLPHITLQHSRPSPTRVPNCPHVVTDARSSNFSHGGAPELSLIEAKGIQSTIH